MQVNAAGGGERRTLHGEGCTPFVTPSVPLLDVLLTDTGLAGVLIRSHADEEWRRGVERRVRDRHMKDDGQGNNKEDG
jgi:hypothetical protein